MPFDPNKHNLKRLSDLHDAIKRHPYRLSEGEQYLKPYQVLLYELSECFWFVVGETQYKEAGGMVHDFNMAVGNIGRRDYSKTKDMVLHVEQCLGVVHTFIDTKEVPVWYEYYTGVNILKSLPRRLKHVYSGNGKYKLDLSDEQIENSLREIESHYSQFPPKKWDDYGIYSKEDYDYFRSLRKETEL